MIGVSGLAKDSIGKTVDNMFDNIALQLIGEIPRLRNKKLAIVSMEHHYGLANLFVKAMQDKVPTQLEQELLKGLLVSADGYIESLKNKTRSNVAEAMDGIARTAKMNKMKVSEEQVAAVLKEEMTKARAHMMAIVESEASKLRNLGTLMNISRMATSVNDDDPSVFFVVVKDGATCKECIRLHLMEDEITPKVYRISELKQGYHKRGENNPSAFGLHPHCRCTIVYLSKGFAFNKEGKTTYHSENYDAYKDQRK
jgi:hypothetical protein